MEFKMLLKLLWLINLSVLAVSFEFVIEDTTMIERNIATTKMIAKLIEESKEATVMVMNLNSEIVESFIRSHGLQITIDINDLITFTSFLGKKFRKIGGTVLHFENYVEFEQFHLLIQNDMFVYDGYFVIIYESGNMREIEQMFSKLWKTYIFNVAVLVPNDTSSDLISVFTYMPFINESCDNTKPIRINEFNKTSMAWTTDLFYPKKFKQLNRCPLRFGCFDLKPGFIIEKDENGSSTVSGIHTDIINMFSDVLNFSVNFIEYEQDLGLVYKNKTATGLLKRAIDNEVDFIFGTFQTDRVEVLTATRTVYTDKLILVVPPPFLIDAMTKIFLPFTLASWISIGMVGLLACCTVITLKFTPKIFHDYVIGSNVRGSVLNVWNIFLGGTQQILPHTNFPRFLLAKFLIFTLIMRSLYQGEVFNILKRDVHTVELKTIDEFVDHQFTFYSWLSMSDKLKGSKAMQRLEVIRYSERRTYNIKTLNPSFRGVVFNHLATVLYENAIKEKKITFRICREALVTNTFGFYFTKNFYLVNEIDQLIGTIGTAGLIEQIMGKYVDINLMTTTENNPPSALTYINIEGFFQLFYCGCAAAIVGFMCEIFVDYRKRKRSKTTRV